MSPKKAGGSLNSSILQVKQYSKLRVYILQDSWRDVIFVPFYQIVKWMMMVLLYLSVMYNIVKLAFPHEDTRHVVDTLLLIIEVLYFAYAGVLVLHRLMKQHRQKRIYAPSPVYVLIFDFISLVPLASLYNTLNKYTWTKQFSEYDVDYHGCYLAFFRIIRLAHFYGDLRKTVTLNQLYISFLAHTLGMFMIVFVLAALMYYTVFHRPSEEPLSWILQWKRNNLTFDETNNMNWFVICSFTIGSLCYNNALAVVYYTNINDAIVVFCSMTVGFIFQYTYLMGSLTSEQLQGMRAKYKTQLRITHATKLMQTLGMSEERRQVLLKYYDTIWTTRHGIVRMPDIIQRLPPMMQNEVKTDIYWEALMHTKIFSELDDVFRRKVVDVMKTEIYMPDHLIFRENDIKAKLIYVQSGIVEISASVTETILLTSGTVLGEVSCIQPTMCIVNVRCVTACTIHALEMVDFYHALQKKHTDEFRAIRNHYKERFKYCKLKLATIKPVPKTSHLAWLRAQWNSFNAGHTVTHHESYSARFLDMIAIVKTVAHQDAFCLRGECPFVMVRETPLYFCLFYLSLAATLVNFFISFRQIAFERSVEIEMYKYFIILDSIFLLDVYIKSITTIKTPHGDLDKPYDIWAYRLKDLLFLACVAGSAPVDYFALIGGASEGVLAALRTVRFLRLYEVVLFFQYHEKRLTSYMSARKFLKYAAYHALITLVLLCVVYFMNCENDKCEYYGVLEVLKREAWARFQDSIKHVSIFYRCIYYTLNVYFKLLLCTYPVYYLPDVGIRIVIIIVSYYIRAYELAQYCALVALKYENEAYLQEQVDVIDIYVSRGKHMKRFRPLLLDVVEAGWYVSSSVRFPDLYAITSQESEFLRKNVTDKHILSILQKTEFFKNFPHHMLMSLAHNCEVFLIPEKHQLVQHNQYCFYLYILIEGYCMQQSKVAGDLERQHRADFGPLDVFPILEYLHRSASLMYVETITAAQVISIPYAVYQGCISVFSQQQTIVNTALQLHMVMNWGLLQLSKFAEADVSKPELDKPVMFQYEIRQEELILDITNSKHQSYEDTLFRKYRRTLRLIMYSTYSPQTTYYLIYEIIHAVCFLLHVNLTFYLVVQPVYLSPWVHFIIYGMYVLWFVDMFIQAHMEYYNKQGLLITSVKATAKNYLCGAFPLYFLAGLPYDLISIKIVMPAQRRNADELILLATARLFLLVRPYKLSVYLQGYSVKFSQILLKYITLMLILYHMIVYLSIIKLLLTCYVDAERAYVCPEVSWIVNRGRYVNWTREYYFSLTVRSVMVSGMSVSDSVYTTFDHSLTLIIGFLVVLIRMALLCLIVGSNCVHQTRVVEHQDSLKYYSIFFRNRMVSNSTKNALQLHYKNLWQKSYSSQSTKVFAGIYPALRESLMMAMYNQAVQSCVLFQGESMRLFTLFIPFVQERNYIKDAEIIRTNDVQANIFIVVSGVVAVSMAGSRLAILGAGGIFGCFEPLGLNRHTMAMTAKQHTTVLVIRSTLFYQLIKGYSKTESVMRHLQFTQLQYATLETHEIVYDTETASTKTKHTDSKHKINYRKMYKMYGYISNVIIAPISVYFLVINATLERDIIRMLPVWIIIDIYFLAFSFVRSRIPKESSDTGLDINREEMTRKYIKSEIFLLDIVTLAPFYMLRVFLYEEQHQIWFLLNKLPRFYFLYYQYNIYNIAKNIPRHMQWTLIIYSALFLGEIIFMIWAFLIQELPYENPTALKLRAVGYIWMMNYVSTTGLLEEFVFLPLGVDMLLSGLALLLTIILSALFVRSMILNNTYESVYRYTVRRCRHFCRLSGVSERLVARTWHYYHYLYEKQGGEQFPRLYFTAPRYLKQDHMHNLFGRHFADHQLFHDMHVDLLRQIQEHIKLNYYVPGAIIEEAGVKNSKIYFIERGNILATQTGETSTFEILVAGKSFGEKTAFLNLEHTRTYKAICAVDLLSVDVDDWLYLLEWFPASKQKLLSRIDEFRIFFENSKRLKKKAMNKRRAKGYKKEE